MGGEEKTTGGKEEKDRERREWGGEGKVRRGQVQKRKGEERKY